MTLIIQPNETSTFQTRYMTSMDVWVLICMVFVASAQFEYAVQLKIRFGGENKVGTADQNQRGAKCSRIDRYSMTIFSGLYVLTIAAYYYSLTV